MPEELPKKHEEKKTPDAKPEKSKTNPELEDIITRMLSKKITETSPEDDSVH